MHGHTFRRPLHTEDILRWLKLNKPQCQRASQLACTFSTSVDAEGAAELLERFEERVNSDPLPRTVHNRSARAKIQRLLNIRLRHRGLEHPITRAVTKIP